MSVLLRRSLACVRHRSHRSLSMAVQGRRWGVPIAATRILDGRLVRDSDKPGIAKGVRYSTVEEDRCLRRGTLQERLNGALQHHARVGLPIAPRKSLSPESDLFLNNRSGDFRRAEKAESAQFVKKRGLPGARAALNQNKIGVIHEHSAGSSEFLPTQLRRNSAALLGNAERSRCRGQLEKRAVDLLLSSGEQRAISHVFDPSGDPAVGFMAADQPQLQEIVG
jgi:hypothetical protein